MSRSRESRHGKRERAGGRASAEAGARGRRRSRENLTNPRGEGSGGARSTDRDGRTARPLALQDKRPVFRFVGLFALLMVLFYAVEVSQFSRKRVFPVYQRINAQVCGAILSVFNEDVNVHGRSVTSPRFTMEIQHACNALLPAALFISAALACPVSFQAKIPGIVIGTTLLMLLNLVRLVALFYTGIHFPASFKRMHMEVWPAIFILFSLVVWIVWARWAQERSGRWARDVV